MKRKNTDINRKREQEKRDGHADDTTVLPW